MHDQERLRTPISKHQKAKAGTEKECKIDKKYNLGLFENEK